MESKAQRLRDARIAAGFGSARSAALSFGWGISTYTAHENGQNEFDADRAREYAKAFKTKPEWLLLGTTTDAGAPGIDAQLRELPPEMSKRLIERFNSIIEGVKLTRKF